MKLTIPFLLIIIAVVLRFSSIIRGDFAFTYDVGRDLLNVKNLLETHKISLIGPTSGQMGIFYGPWWTWLIALPYLLSQGDPSAISFFVTVCGILAMIIVYIWGNKYLGILAGLAMAGVMAVSEFFLSTSIQIWNPNLLVLTTVLILVLHGRIETLRPAGFFLLGFLLLISVEFEFVYGIFLLISYSIILLTWRRKILSAKKIFWLILGGLFIELPRLIFEFRHDFLQTKALFSFLKIGEGAPLNFFQRLSFIWEKWLVVIPDLSPAISFLITFMMAIIIVFRYKDLSLSLKPFLIDLISIFSIFIFLTIIYPKDFWDYYLLGLPVILIFFPGFFFHLLEKHGKKFSWITLWIYFFLLAWSSGLFSRLFHPNFIGDQAVYRNQIAAVDYVYRQADGKNFNYIAYTPPLIEHTWRYLFGWYGRKKYKYLPSETRQEKFYVIIEPDLGYEGRITGWLKVREGDGKIIRTDVLPSGIKIQTRIRPKEEN